MKIIAVIFVVLDSALYTENIVNDNFELCFKYFMSFKHVNVFVKEKSNNYSLLAFHP